MSDEAKEHSKRECQIPEQQKRKDHHLNLLKKKIKAAQEIAKELVEEVPTEPTIINNHYYNEAPK